MTDIRYELNKFGPIESLKVPKIQDAISAAAETGE